MSFVPLIANHTPFFRTVAAGGGIHFHNTISRITARLSSRCSHRRSKRRGKRPGSYLMYITCLLEPGTSGSSRRRAVKTARVAAISACLSEITCTCRGLSESKHGGSRMRPVVVS